MASDMATEEISTPKSPNGKLQELHESHTKIVGLHLDATARLNKLEQRVNRLEDNDSASDTSSEASDLDDYMLGYEENVVPEVRDVDFEHFKNRYTEQEGKYCIEALVAGPDFEEQVRRELKRRDLLEEDDMKPFDNYDESDEEIIHRVRIQSPSILFLLYSVLENGQSNGSFLWKGQNRTTFFRPFTWFIYAQSKMRLKLEELEDQFSNRPSISSVTSAQTVAELAASFEQATILDKSTSASRGASTSEATPAVHSRNSVGTLSKSLAKRVERNVIEQALLESYQTILALRCYVEFVEKRIIPQAATYRESSEPAPSSVRFQDLSYLFRVGYLVYVPPLPMNVQQVTGQPIGRIREIEKPDATASSTPQNFQVDFSSCRPRRRKGRELNNIFVVQYYRIDYNGDNYIPIYSTTVIPRFRGQMEITSLPLYPLRYHPEREQLSLAAEECGKKFQDSVMSRHMLYCGWSSVPPSPTQEGPPGGPMYPRQHNMPPPPPQYGHHPPARPGVNAPNNFDPATLRDDIRDAAFHKVNYIESDVIVDVKEAVRAVPHWGLPVRPWPITSWIKEKWSIVQDSVEIIRWADRHRKAKLSNVQDRTQADDGIANLECAAFIREDQFWRPKRNPDFTAEDFALLPKRLYAYALRERKFFSGNVDSFFKIATEDDPFENLKIDEKHIRIVKSVVWSHFQRKNMESLSSFQSQMDQDLIRGKGRGLVILLHGAPGVGKTATAEAVALWHRKPLFVITCGDLGFTPQGVESSLGEIFRLAHLWDCILLLDEADVFLSQRETSALQRNALVSVFLRVLEYYNGILFLTTNRVGTLDEAFKSRVHLSLYYPALGRFQTEQIMRLNLDRLEVIEKQRAASTSQKPLFIRKDGICKFAGDHWDRHFSNDGEGRWNGRQIRNAVQIAASLALYDRKIDTDQGAEDFPPVLDERHFETVEHTMALFEDYMNKTRGGSAMDIAEHRSERYDRFQTPQRGLTRDQQYETPGNHRAGGYVPYQSQPQAPQFPEIPQPYPAVQHYPQHLGPSGPTRSSPGTSATFMAAESTRLHPPQEGVFRPAAPQQVPSGVPLPFAGVGQTGQTSGYNTAGPPPPGVSFPPQDQFRGNNAGRQGYEAAN
ncbi:hypothetical protein F5Y10DRAFT_293311 [Nemania abortiva]|nr:hypothetical protein F5Y10DRAFT_293311 [Nemania abortiva]